MQDLWRLSAADIASLIRSKKVSAKEAATAALARLDAVNPMINAVVDHQPAEVLAQACRHRRDDRARRGCRAAGGRAGYGQGQYRPGRLCHHQRPQAAARCHREEQQPGDRQSAQGGRRHSRPHQLPGVFLSLVHHQSGPRRHQKPARPRYHAGRLVRRRRARRVAAGIGHIAHGTDIAGSIRYPAYANGVHGLRPTLGRIAAFNAALPERPIGPQMCAVSGPLARTIADLRIALGAMSGWDARDPGGCRRRWKARRCRSASPCASIRWTRSRAGSESRDRGRR